MTGQFPEVTVRQDGDVRVAILSQVLIEKFFLVLAVDLTDFGQESTIADERRAEHAVVLRVHVLRVGRFGVAQ